MLKHARLLLIALLAGCAGLQSNPTVYPYRIDRMQLEAQPVRTVVIAPFGLNGAPRSTLRDAEPLLRRELAAYLEKNGLRVIDNNALNVSWQNAVRQFGNPWDPSTGRSNAQTLALAMRAAIREARAQSPFDAVIVADLVERETFFDPLREYRARWDGVSRRVTLTGPDNYVDIGFNWNQPVAAISLAINLYSPDLQHLFHSVGGIDVLDDIDTRHGSARFSRRSETIRAGSNLREGIALALHPFVPMKHYPGPR